jgi:hypothetical protein
MDLRQNSRAQEDELERRVPRWWRKVSRRRQAGKPIDDAVRGFANCEGVKKEIKMIMAEGEKNGQSISFHKT